MNKENLVNFELDKTVEKGSFIKNTRVVHRVKAGGTTSDNK